MTTLEVLVIVLPLLTIVVTAAGMNRRQERGQAGESWWSSPRRRAEVGEAHPYLIFFFVMAVVTAPFAAASGLIDGSASKGLSRWATGSALGTTLGWIWIWRTRRRDVGRSTD